MLAKVGTVGRTLRRLPSSSAQPVQFFLRGTGSQRNENVTVFLAPTVCVAIETYYAWFRRMMYTQEFEKCVVLVMDEMHIREDLVYNKHSGELIGLMNLGDINSHLLRFARSLSDEDQQMEPLAKTMFTIMVRGLFTRLQFPYAQFLVPPFRET